MSHAPPVAHASSPSASAAPANSDAAPSALAEESWDLQSDASLLASFAGSFALDSPPSPPTTRPLLPGPIAAPVDATPLPSAFSASSPFSSAPTLGSQSSVPSPPACPFTFAPGHICSLACFSREGKSGFGDGNHNGVGASPPNAFTAAGPFGQTAVAAPAFSQFGFGQPQDTLKPGQQQSGFGTLPVAASSPDLFPPFPSATPLVGDPQPTALPPSFKWFVPGAASFPPSLVNPPSAFATSFSPLSFPNASNQTSQSPMTMMSHMHAMRSLAAVNQGLFGAGQIGAFAAGSTSSHLPSLSPPCAFTAPSFSNAASIWDPSAPQRLMFQPPSDLRASEKATLDVISATYCSGGSLFDLRRFLLSSDASSSTPVDPVDLCWLLSVPDFPVGATVLTLYLAETNRPEPSHSFADVLRMDDIVRKQLQKQSPMRFTPDRFSGASDPNSAARFQATLLTRVVSTGFRPARRAFALDVLRMLLTGPDWPENLLANPAAGFSDSWDSLVAEWSREPDLVPERAAANEEGAPEEAVGGEDRPSLCEQAAVLLVQHGLPLGLAWPSLIERGQPALLLRLLDAVSITQLVPAIRSYPADAWKGARDRRQTMSRLCMRIMIHCQQLLGAHGKEATTGTDASAGSARSALVLQSWIRSAASCIGSHPVVVCVRALEETGNQAQRNAPASVFGSAYSSSSSMLPAWRARVERAIQHLSLSDLTSVPFSQSLLVRLQSDGAEWVRQALLQRLHTLTRAPINDASARSGCDESPLSVLFPEASLSSTLSSLCDDVIITLMCSREYADRPAWESLLRMLLQFARDASIIEQLWPFNPDSTPTATQPHLRCSHPWALLTRDHTHYGQNDQNSLPVASLLHECGVTVGERGESFTQHVCAEGPWRTLRDWIRQYSQYSLTAGWLNDPVEVEHTPFSGEISDADAADAIDPPGLRAHCAIAPQVQNVPEEQEDGPPQPSSFKHQWLHARGACQRIMLHATRWLRSVGALRIRRALLPHLIPDLHSIVVDYLLAEPAEPKQCHPATTYCPQSMMMIGEFPTAAASTSPATAAAASTTSAVPPSAESFAALRDLLHGTESGSLSRAEIVASLYEVIALRKLEEEERAAEAIGKDEFKSIDLM